jgi:large conductance mechanosensitive channel
MWKEFKEFAIKGNVIDLAIAVVIGTAFGAIVTSLVNDIIMPIIGQVTGGVDFRNLYINLSGGNFASLDDAKKGGAATINYGVFINTIITFLIIAFVLFLVIRAINKMKREPVPPEVQPDVKDCPYCLSKIPTKATRCLYCTSDLKTAA